MNEKNSRDVRKVDVTTQTSLSDINLTTSHSFTVTTDEWDESSLEFPASIQLDQRDIEVQTDVTIAANIIYTSTSSSIFSPGSGDFGEASESGSPIPSDAKEQTKPSEPAAESSAKKPARARFAGFDSSSEEIMQTEVEEKKHTYRKSKFIRKSKVFADDDDDDLDPELYLQQGDVFVYMVIPPDGGYGWFVMLISFLCQVVVDGIVFGVGVILPHIAREFGIPGSQVILLSSTQVGCYFLFGTVSSTLLSKYGFRPVAAVGSTLSIIVLCIATYSNNFPMMLLCFSIIGGPCLSMIWVTSQLVIGYYFDKYRPIANGISCSGAGVGIMTFSFMNNVLVTKLGWRILMRLHVALLVVVFLLGLSFIEVAPTRIGRVVDAQLEESESESWDDFESVTRFSRFQRFSRFSVRVDDDEYSLHSNFEDVLTEYNEPPPRPFVQRCCEKYCCLCQRLFKPSEAAVPQGYVIQQDLMDRNDLFYTGTADVRNEATSAPRKTVVFGGEDMRVISLDELQTAVDSRLVAQRLSAITSARESVMDRRKTYHELKLEKKKYPLLAFFHPSNWIHPKIRAGVLRLFNAQLLQVVEFRILLLSAFLFPLGFNIPFVYSTQRVQIVPFYARFISPTIGLSNFVFRILSGFIAYRFREYTAYICGGGMVFGGVTVFVSAFYGIDKVWFQFLYAICYGVAPAFYSTLRAIIYVQSLGLERLTNAFGLTALAMGMGVFIGTTAAGILNDLTGDYSAAFALSGVSIILSGLLKLSLPFVTNRGT